MRKIDFLSQSPRTYIFGRITNKTIFGGIIFMLYLFMMIFISIYYIYNYIIGDKYEYFYSYRELSQEQKKKAFAGLETNPPISIKLDAFNELDWNISDSLKFIYYSKHSNEQIIYRDEWTEIHIPDYIVIDLYYSSQNISDFKADDIKDIEFGEYFDVNFTYKTFYLDHQNPKCPFKSIFLSKYLRFNFERNFILYINWEFTKYSEKNDIFKIFSNYLRRPIKYLDGSFSINEFIDEKNNNIYKDIIIDGEIHKYLGSFVIYNSKNTIHEYQRQKKEWLTVLANIFALGSTFYNLFSKIFYLFYSKNYDNYKIIKKILSLDASIQKTKTIFVSEATNLQLNNFSIDKKGDEKTLGVREIQVINSNKSNSSNNNDKTSEYPTSEKEEKEYKDDESDNSLLNLPKQRFINFILNRLFIHNCCKSNKQKLITLCNSIIYKYNSIENILYNQIRFENLLNDYKWNNPKLNDIQNNKTILEIRNNLQI